MPTEQAPAAAPTWPGGLDAELETRFRDRGYLAFEAGLNPEEVEAARAGLSRIVTRLHRLGREGADSVSVSEVQGDTNYSGVRISAIEGRCSLLFERNTDPLASGAEEAELLFRNLYHFEDQDPVFERLVRHPRLLKVVEGLIGPEPILFQTMALSKPPRIGSEKPWHQDNAYFNFVPLEQIVGVWIALDDATRENGCMHVIPGGHRTGALRHEHRADCQIVEGRLAGREQVPIELKAGGALFFYGMLPHFTPRNRSDRRRRSLQFHFRGAETRPAEADEYRRVFAEADGTPASCAAARR
jgi:phytanoyl-CoA hydroxylase